MKTLRDLRIEYVLETGLSFHKDHNDPDGHDYAMKYHSFADLYTEWLENKILSIQNADK